MSFLHLLLVNENQIPFLKGICYVSLGGTIKGCHSLPDFSQLFSQVFRKPTWITLPNITRGMN